MREPMAGNPPGPTTDGDPESRSFRQDDRVLVVLGSLFMLLQLVYWTSDERAASVAFIVMRVAAVVTFAWGVAPARPGFRRDWGLMLAGMVVWALAEVAVAVRIAVLGEYGDWTPAGVFDMAGFVLMCAGVVRLACKDGFVRGSALWLDSMACVVSLAICWWLLVGQELFSHPDQARSTTLLAAAYPLGDSLIVAAAAVLLSSRSAHAISYRLLVLGMLVGAVSDVGFGLYVSGEMPSNRWVYALWMVQSTLLATASVLGRRPGRELASRVSVAGVLLVVSALVGPATVLAVLSALGRHTHASAVLATLAGTLLLLLIAATRVLVLVRRIEKQSDQLARTARTDELTGLANRRAGLRLMDEAIAAAMTGVGARLTVGMLDLDNFKSFNDAHGHLQGDRILRASAHAWIQVLDDDGSIYRYGGEEFVVILPNRSVADAEKILARMRAATPDDQTFSAGLAAWSDGDSSETLLARADVSLYAAKEAGRARTMVIA